MQEYKGPERRQSTTIEYREILDRMSGLDVKLGIVETKIDGLKQTNVDVKDDLEKHMRADNWIDGFFLTILVTILAVLLKH